MSADVFSCLTSVKMKDDRMSEGRKHEFVCGDEWNNLLGLNGS